MNIVSSLLGHGIPVMVPLFFTNIGSSLVGHAMLVRLRTTSIFYRRAIWNCSIIHNEFWCLFLGHTMLISLRFSSLIDRIDISPHLGINVSPCRRVDTSTYRRIDMSPCRRVDVDVYVKAR